MVVMAVLAVAEVQERVVAQETRQAQAHHKVITAVVLILRLLTITALEVVVLVELGEMLQVKLAVLAAMV